MPITLHIEAASVEELHDSLRKLLPPAGTPAVTQTEIDKVIYPAADIDTDKIAPEAEKPKRLVRPKKQPVDTAPADDHPSAPPAFLEGRPAAEPAPAALEPTAEMSLDDMRAAMNDLAAKKGMPEVAKLLNSFKRPDGSPCEKASQVQPAERAVLAAKCKELAA